MFFQKRKENVETNIKNNNKGFTLLEVLIALVIVSTMLIMLAGGNPFSPRKSLTKTLDNVESALRFAMDEAAIRNRIIRVRFIFNEKYQEYTIEYGPDADLVLPLSVFKTENNKIKTSDEKKAKNNKHNKLNSEFYKITEFSEDSIEIDGRVRLVGVGTSLYDGIVTSNEASIYIYPSGEKDAAFIALSLDYEMATIKVDPFTLRFEREYHQLNPDDSDLDGLVENAIQLFNDWKKGN